MTESTNHRPWSTETPSHKISHDEYYEKRGTTDKTTHKPRMLQPRIRHRRITTRQLTERTVEVLVRKLKNLIGNKL